MHLSLKRITATLSFISLLLLFACSTTPLSIQLQPEFELNQNAPLLSNKIDWQVNSQDQRIAQYLIETSNGKDAATLINEAQSSRLLIANTLQQQWQKRGLTFASSSKNIIDIQIINLLAKVDQKTLLHNTRVQVVINIKLITNNSVFTKTFISKTSQEGAFKADIKEINNQLNAQLSELLNKIIQDPELNGKLEQR